MAGLDNIIRQITAEAEENASALKKDAEGKAARILENAKAEAAKYMENGYGEAKRIIDDMPTDKVKDYLKQLIEDNIVVGVEIIKDKK